MKEMPEDERLLTLKEAMEYLGVARNTLYRFMGERGLIGHKVGSTWRFYLGDLRNFVKGKQVIEQVEVAGNGIDQG
jgi:excisionase family DNA binding protein